MFDDMTRNEKVVLGLVGVMLGVAVLSSASAQMLLILGIAGLAFFIREREKAQQGRRGRRGRLSDRELFDEHPVRPERSTYAEHIHPHAIQAARNAGNDPDDLPVLPTDIGMIAFVQDKAPTLYRSRDVPDDVDYVQPFVELRVPIDARGKVRFEIIDPRGRPVFVHEDYHDLRRGRNLISPSARMPVHDELETGDNWGLRILADGVLLAHHRYFWEPAPEGIRQHIGEDGEISSELRAILAESRLQPMSLDDLLAAQDEEENNQARR